MGLTVSDAFRLMMVRIAREKALPFDPLVPNDKTIEAMKAARGGELTTAGPPERLPASLNEHCQAHEPLQKSERHSKQLDIELLKAVTMLAQDEPLPRRYFDHSLAGEWNDHRDCHIRPDPVLIYRKPDESSLDRDRLGSHGELGL
jgi:mRNA interferase YafQ